MSEGKSIKSCNQIGHIKYHCSKEEKMGLMLMQYWERLNLPNNLFWGDLQNTKADFVYTVFG